MTTSLKCSVRFAVVWLVICLIAPLGRGDGALGYLEPVDGSVGDRQENATHDDLPLKHWRANFSAVKDFECHFTNFAVSDRNESWEGLARAGALKDDRGYFRTAEFHLKFQPNGRLYYLDGNLQASASDESNGGWGDVINAHDGKDHRSFVESEYNGLIQAKESLNIRLITNPMHFFCADLDLGPLFRDKQFTRVDHLTYEVETYFGQNRSFPSKLVFHLSPEHGYQPRMIDVRLTDGQLRARYVVEQFHQIDDVWFPIVGRRKLFRHGKTVTHESLTEIDPATLRLNQNLQPADFHFQFPPGSTYLNEITGQLVQGEEADRRALKRRAEILPQYQEPSRGRYLWWAVAAIVALGLGWLILNVYSSRRQR